MIRFLLVLLFGLLPAATAGAAPSLTYSTSNVGDCLTAYPTWQVCFDPESPKTVVVSPDGATVDLIRFTLSGSGPSRTWLSGPWRATLHLQDDGTGQTADVPVGGTVFLGVGSPYAFSATLDSRDIQVGDRWFRLSLASVLYPGPYGDTLHAYLAGLLVYTPAGPAPTGLKFLTQPGGADARQPINPQPVVAVVIADGSVDTAYQGPVTVEASFDTNANGSALQGTTTVNTVNGIATFADLSFSKSANARLSASIASLTPVLSQGFFIRPIPAGLRVSPIGDQAPGVPLVGVSVQVMDESGSPYEYTDYTKPITVSLQPGSGAPGATLSGTATRTATPGPTSFPDLSIDKPGTGYVLLATSEGLVPGASLPFNVGWEWAARRALQVTGGLSGEALPTSLTLAPAWNSPIDLRTAVLLARKAAGLD